MMLTSVGRGLGILKVLYYRKPLTRLLATSVSSTPNTEVVPEGSAAGRAVKKQTEEEGRPSFAREIFAGRFDTDVLTFPEILEKERHTTLHNMLEPIERFFVEKVDSKKIDTDAKLPQAVLDGLKELGLFGQQIPEEYGGLGLNATEYARIAEVVSRDGAVGVTLAAHQAIGLKGLLLYGTEKQKQKYLPRLASGEWIAAFCLTEPSSGSDAASVQTKATMSKDGKSFVLNGSKIWISNGGIADFFTVFAQTSDDKLDKRSSKRLTAFLVEKSFGGITTGKPEDKLGIRGSNTCEVHFENTVVPTENIIGSVGEGFKVAVNILNSGRFSMGSAGAGFLKKLIASTTEHAITRKQFGKSLTEFELIREKLARMTISTYVMESMAYLTAGLIDSNQYADCAVEAAIVKVYSSEGCWEHSSECLQILGGLGYMKEYPYERVLRDSRIMLIFEGTNEILRLFIALMGVQYAGKELRELVKKIRNPFQNPGLLMQKMFQNFKQARGRPKMTLRLHEYLHPSLKDSANQLEFATHRLQFAVETALRIHGTNITEAQLILKRIADIAIDIYGMTAVLARSSRSYCTGIRHGNAEILIATAFCQQAFERVQRNVDEIVAGKYINGDQQLVEIASEVEKAKGYFPEHPLTRNIW